MPDKLPVISLFSGSGGLDWGFHREGFDTLLAVDNDPTAVATYNRNHPQVAQKINLLTTPIKDFVARCQAECSEVPRGVVGGPPCQAYSLGNVHPIEQDPRARLVYRYTSIVRELHELYDLDFFVFENVGTLASPRNESAYRRFCGALERAGFILFKQVLDAQNFGVPQRRPRLFVVGFNKDRFPSLSFDFPKQSRKRISTVRDAIGHLSEPILFEHGLNPDDFPVHPNHWAMSPRSKKFSDGSLTSRRQYGRSFRVLDWKQPSWTVAYGHREVHVHPRGHRRLSVHEAMLLQGFPRDYRLMGTLSDQIRLVSDAVPPPLARAVAKQIKKALTEEGQAKKRPSRRIAS